MTTTRLELPSGDWVDFRDGDDVSERLRRPVIVRAARAATIAAHVADLDLNDPALATDVDVEFVREFNDLIAMCFVAGWSFDMPVTIDSLIDLPGPAYDAITDYGQRHANALFPASPAAE